MKAVLISIQPKWVEKIASGEKTIEVRKSMPKLKRPFKVYIYCTKEKSIYDMLLISNEKGFEKSVSFGDYRNHGFGWEIGNCKVIGEFVCDRIDELPCGVNQPYWLKEKTCISNEDYKDYLGNKNGYGWHISDLKIYDKQKELSEFYQECKGICVDTAKKILCLKIKTLKTLDGCDRKIPLKRPPQSWCYVEELKNG